jgi:hypothetical protein
MMGGLICSKCGAKIPGEEIKVIGYTEYEGLSVDIFVCPFCNQETDDLQCDIWEENE